MKRIYLDYASLTPVDKKVSKVLNRYSTGEYTNPSALYTSAVKAKKAMEDAKVRIAKVLHAHPDEILFTSGGTESNQLALTGHKTLISEIEHSSIINQNNILKVSVTADGILNLEDLKKKITPDITLVSVMMVNNEIGTIQPIQDIAKIVRDYRKANNTKYPLLHTDACQAFIHTPINLEKLGVDMLTLDGHKVYGPRGIGMLYVKRGSPEITRTGTENIPAIMGFTEALEIADIMREKETMRISELKSYFINGLKKIKINGNLEKSVPNILNISIPDIDNEFFVLQLDAKGIECSTKSACLKDSDESYVLKAIGVNSKNSIRFSFGRFTKLSDIKKTLKIIKNIVK
jgi:cysteine desulfurase